MSLAGGGGRNELNEANRYFVSFSPYTLSRFSSHGGEINRWEMKREFFVDVVGVSQSRKSVLVLRTRLNFPGLSWWRIVECQKTRVLPDSGGALW